MGFMKVLYKRTLYFKSRVDRGLIGPSKKTKHVEPNLKKPDTYTFNFNVFAQLLIWILKVVRVFALVTSPRN